MRQTRCKERNKFWKNPFLHAYHINEVERVRIINYIFILIWVYRKHIVHACNFSINPKWSELSTAHLDHNLHFCFSSLSLSLSFSILRTHNCMLHSWQQQDRQQPEDWVCSYICVFTMNVVCAFHLWDLSDHKYNIFYFMKMIWQCNHQRNAPLLLN